MRKLLVATTASVALAGGLLVAGVGLYQAREHELSARPPRVAHVQHEAEIAPVSRLAVNLRLPYEALRSEIIDITAEGVQGNGRAHLDFDVAQQVEQFDNGEIWKGLTLVLTPIVKILTLNQHISADVDYSYGVRASAPPQLTPLPDGFRIEQPLRVEGGAGFAGDGARILGIGRKNVRGDYVLRADFGFTLDERWCPVLTVRAAFDGHGEIEALKDQWVSVDGAVRGGLTNLAEQIARQAAAILPCEPVRKTILEAFQPRAIPISVPGNSLFAAVVPVSATVTKVEFGSDAITVGAALDAKVTVSSRQPVLQMVDELPKLAKADSLPGRVSFQVPFDIDYQSVTKAGAVSVIGHEFTTSGMLGRFTLRPNHLKIYPTSEGKVALAIHVVGYGSGWPFGTSGTLYVIAQPEYDASRQVLAFRNVHVTATNDHRIMSLFDPVIALQIERSLGRAELDASAPLTQLRQQVIDSMQNDLHRVGIDLGFQEASLRVNHVHADDAGVTAEVNFTALPTLATVDILRLVESPQRGAPK